MRKCLAALGVVVTALVVVSPAAAEGYYIPLAKANHIARETAREECEAEVRCESYEWSCRISGRGATCLEALIFESEYGPITCENALHLTIGPGGYIRRSLGKVQCH